MLQDFCRYCIESLAADSCLDPGCKSSGKKFWGRCVTVSDNDDICAYLMITNPSERIDHVVQSLVAQHGIR